MACGQLGVLANPPRAKPGILRAVTYSATAAPWAFPWAISTGSSCASNIEVRRAD